MKKPKFTSTILFVLIGVLLIVISSAFFVNFSIQSIVKEIREEAKPDERLVLLKEVTFQMAIADNSVKSYGLTKNENYIDSYNHSINHINRDVDALYALTNEAEYPFYRQIAHIDSLIDKKFYILDQLVLVQNQQSIDSLIEKVQNTVADVSLETDFNATENDAITPSDKNRFFQRVFGNRKKKENEDELVDYSSYSAAEVEESFIKIDREIDRIRIEESKKEAILKTRELALIRQDRGVMDEISTIMKDIEKDERIKMQQQIEISQSNGDRTSWMIALFCIISCSLLGLAGYIIYTYVLKNNAYKAELIYTKDKTEHYNKEILASINYAKRIQNAILPDSDKINSLFKDSFVLYKPKDIVAGDFYWMTQIDGCRYIAVADCTGHGVSGAMVSMSCSSALNRAVKEFGLRDTDAILNKSRELIIETFNEGEPRVYDGMDISLCRINDTTQELQFSGANNSLYIVKQGNLTEIKPDKQPVAHYDKSKPFTHTQIKVEKDDTFYLYTDGFADQFGGEKGKKFLAHRLKKLLATNAHLDFETQLDGIDKTLKKWQGDQPQVDDICLVGFRL